MVAAASPIFMYFFSVLFSMVRYKGNMVVGLIETGGFALRKFNHFLILLIAEIVAIEECGVEGVVVFSHFVMEVAACGSACIAHITNELSAFDFLSAPHRETTQMSV